MEALRITQAALKAMARESRLTQGRTETGGLMIGTLKKPTVIIATDAGPGSSASPGHFQSDDEYEQRRLDEARERYDGKVGVVGHWHCHPDAMSALSAGDREQALELAREEGPLYVLITNVIPSYGRTDVRYYAYRIDGESATVTRVEIVAIPDDGSEVRQALEGEPPSLGVSKKDFWLDEKFSFCETSVGLAALRREVEELTRKGFAVRPTKNTADGSVQLEIRRDREVLVCNLPREYPLNPPRFRWKESGCHIVPDAYRLGWNSDCRISDLVSDLFPPVPTVKDPSVAEEEQQEKGASENEGDSPQTHFPTFGRLARILYRAAGGHLRRNEARRRPDPHCGHW
jgi:integrative and conjugative element protein (TIGR02256 family)